MCIKEVWLLLLRTNTASRLRRDWTWCSSCSDKLPPKLALVVHVYCSLFNSGTCGRQKQWQSPFLLIILCLSFPSSFFNHSLGHLRFKLQLSNFHVMAIHCKLITTQARHFLVNFMFLVTSQSTSTGSSNKVILIYKLINVKFPARHFLVCL